VSFSYLLFVVLPGFLLGRGEGHFRLRLSCCGVPNVGVAEIDGYFFAVNVDGFDVEAGYVV
jgi:hypothetical protein